MSKLDVFSHFQPLDLGFIKSEDGGKVFKIKGIATTEHIDTAGEVIKQNGIDWSYCLNVGSFNYDHSNLPGHILGAPQEIKVVKHNGKMATEISGILYGDKQIVKDLIENVKLMRSTKSGRKLGFSIEGQVIKRDSKNPKIITAAKVLNVSLTHQPANPQATVELVKNILANMETKENMDLKKEYQDLPMSYRQSEQLLDYADKLCKLLGSFPADTDLPEWVQSKITKSLDYIQASYHYLDIELKERGIEVEKDVNPDYLESLEEESVVDPEDASPRGPEYVNDYPHSFEMNKAKIDIEEDDSASDIAAKILEVHPELRDADIMAALHALIAEKSISKGYKYKSEEEMEKMDNRQLIEYIKFLEGLSKEAEGKLNIGMDDKVCDECEDCDGDCSKCPKCQERKELDKQSDMSPIQEESLEDGELASEDVSVEMLGLTQEQLKKLIEEMIKLKMDDEKLKSYLKIYQSYYNKDEDKK